MSGTVKLPNGRTGFVPHGDAAKHQNIIDKRHAIAMAYCRENGWPEDASQLSIAQIMEIRALPEWKAAGQ